MKKVLYGEELREKILEAVELLGNTVSTTLGPTGNNVLISNGESAPFITNDGVTIASSLESEEKEMNAILEILKESSLKTNELVGDGTTTTIVLLQSIIKEGMEEIRKGKNPLTLKKELQESLEKILPLLEEKKKTPTKEDFFSTASTSANSKEIGKILSDVFSKVHRKSSITLEESMDEETHILTRKGYIVEINSLSSLYFQKEKKISLKNPSILILKGYLENLEYISECINECLRENRPLVIVTEEMEEILSQELLSYYLNEGKELFIISLSELGTHRDQEQLDLSILSGATIKNVDYEKVLCKDLGRVEEIILEREQVTIASKKNIQEYLLSLKKELEEVTSDYEKEFQEKRLSNLEDDKITIQIGSCTKTEMKELKMRYEDALCALEVARKGILPGEGIPLLEIGDNLIIETTGDEITKKALSSPFYKIIENMGESPEKLHKKIQENQYQKIYYLETSSLEDISNTKILDPLEVVITSCKNAFSIASMLLTITHLVINEEDLEKKEYSL